MKKITTIICIVLFAVCRSQTFTGSSGAIQNNGQDTYFPLSVSGLSAPNDSTYGLEQVCLTISHPAAEELNIYLVSPSGTKVQLAIWSSCSGPAYTNTCFNSSAGTSISLGSSPYTGTFKPIGYLGRFNTGVNGNGTWNLIVKDWNVNANSGALISWSITFGNAPSHPVVFSSTNLPIVILNTTQPIIDTKTLINMGVIDNGSSRNHPADPMNNYNAKAQIHIRGSSTKDFEKKSYSVETADMSGNKLVGPLLGMPEESDWDLISVYQDKSLIRDPLIYDLSRMMGHYAPRYKNVEVILNNEYQGIYELTEKPKRDSNRIHVNKLSPTDNSYPNITGGYVIKIDRNTAPGWNSLFPGNFSSSHFFYNYEYPNPSNISTQQQTYIKNYVDSFETAMNSPTYADPTIGYPKYIHTGSFIDYFILSELSKNPDAYRLSTYIFKDRITHGGKLHIGPVWDYNIALHNCNYGNASSPSGWQYQIPASDPTPVWWDKLMHDSNFVDELYCRYTSLRQNILSVSFLNNYIDSSANVLNESQQRNFVQWPIMGTYIFPNPQYQPGASFWGEVADLKTWLSNRLAWLDGAITGTCSFTTVDQNKLVNGVKIYPNPMQNSSTFFLQLTERSDVSLCLTDLTGKEVSRYLNSNVPPGDSEIKVERNNMPAGIYFYQLQINSKVTQGKIVIQ